MSSFTGASKAKKEGETDQLRINNQESKKSTVGAITTTSTAKNSSS